MYSLASARNKRHGRSLKTRLALPKSKADGFIKAWGLERKIMCVYTDLCAFLQKNIDALERVQRRASKDALPMSSRDSPYEERLTMLGWSSLQSTRSYLSLLECYKTIHGLNRLECDNYFEFNCHSRTRFNLRQQEKIFSLEDSH